MEALNLGAKGFDLGFVPPNKEIIWASNADINSDITTAEAAKGYTHVALDNDDIPNPDKFYVNSDATAVSTKTLFDPNFLFKPLVVPNIAFGSGTPSPIIYVP